MRSVVNACLCARLDQGFWHRHRLSLKIIPIKSSAEIVGQSSIMWFEVFYQALAHRSIEFGISGRAVLPIDFWRRRWYAQKAHHLADCGGRLGVELFRWKD